MRIFSREKTAVTPHTAGVLYLLSAAFLFTVHSWIIKVAKDYLDTWQIGFGRWLFGLVLVWFLAKASGINLFAAGNKRLLLIRGLVGTIGYLAIVYATQMIPISQSTVLFFACPMFAAINGMWLNKQAVSAMHWLYILGGFVGVVLVLEPGADGFDLHAAHFIALASAFFGGMAMALTRKLTSNNHSYTIFFYFCLVGVPVSAGPALNGISFIWPGWWIVTALLAASALGSLAQLLLNWGFKHVPAHVGAVILSSQVVLTAIVGVFMLNESLTWSMATGSCLILACGALLSRNKKTKPKARSG